MDRLANIGTDSAAPRVRDQLKLAVERLSVGGINGPRLDAEVLLAHCLNLRREQRVALKLCCNGV